MDKYLKILSRDYLEYAKKYNADKILECILKHIGKAKKYNNV